jgi:hypothetical protein
MSTYWVHKFNNKKNIFPSAFATYEISDKSSVSLSYSKRLDLEDAFRSNA